MARKTRTRAAQRAAVDPTPILREHWKTRREGRVSYGYCQWPGDSVRTYYGRTDDPETQAAFDRDLVVWISNGRRFPEVSPGGVTVSELCEGFRQAMVTKHGAEWMTSTGGGGRLWYALEALEGLYGTEAAAEFSVVKLRIVRDSMVQKGLNLAEINLRSTAMIRPWRFGAERGLVPASVHAELALLTKLDRNDAVKVLPPRQPVARDVVDKTLVYLTPVLADVVRLLGMTGARPSEILGLRKADIDTSDPELWVARLAEHKTAKKTGVVRVLVFGPEAQALLRPRMVRPGASLLFEGRLGVRESGTLGKAVALAARRAGVPHWCSYQLRHLVCTEIAELAGDWTASILLGHVLPAGSSKVTAGYDHSDPAVRARRAYRAWREAAALAEPAKVREHGRADAAEG